MSKKYSSLVERLEELLIEEHVGACDQSTCDINSAYNNGYSLWAIYLFDSCGAASNEFIKLYRQLPKRFVADAERERKDFVDSVEHVECHHCNAVIWEPCLDSTVYCDSCGETFKIVETI